MCKIWFYLTTNEPFQEKSNREILIQTQGNIYKNDSVFHLLFLIRSYTVHGIVIYISYISFVNFFPSPVLYFYFISLILYALSTISYFKNGKQNNETNEKEKENSILVETSHHLLSYSV